MTCVYHYKRQPYLNSNTTLGLRLGFQLSNAALPTCYTSLQPYLDFTDHSQNDVIASQHKCHDKLSLHEFVTYGSLRAGHRLQLRNLYKAMSCRSLNFEDDAVLALLLQVIWQVGPAAGKMRESHQDFQDDYFAAEYLLLIEKTLKELEDNSSNYRMLFASVLMARRIMDVNENCSEKGYALLKRARGIMQGWKTQLNTELGKPDSNHYQLKELLDTITWCSLVTFYVADGDHFRSVLKTGRDVADFLHVISARHGITWGSTEKGIFGQVLLHLGTKISIAMGLEQAMKSYEFVRDGILLYIQERWPKAVEYTDEKVECEEKENWFVVYFGTDHVATVDVLTGELLVDGKPTSELAKNTMYSDDFNKVFNARPNLLIFRESDVVAKTIHPWNRRHYKFHSGQFRWSPVIFEIDENGNDLVLVPQRVFGGYLNQSLISNYTHWYHMDSGCVHFRKGMTVTGDSQFDDDYICRRAVQNSTQNWQIVDNRINQYIFSIGSSTFRQTANALKNIELSQYLTVLLSKDNRLAVHLSRHNLSFSMDASGKLCSKEYPTFSVSREQIGKAVFVGLQSGLMLENGIKKLLLMPNGDIKIEDNGSIHHKCVVELQSLRKPSFYVFEFDDVLRRIQARKSTAAWLYLAALHASSSSSMPEPFTSLTGTEAAVDILTSARVWSDSPYDLESLTHLKFIRHLTPPQQQRTYYRYEYQSGEEKVPTLGRFEGYIFIVDKLVEDSARLQSLHSTDASSRMYENLKRDIKERKDKPLLRSFLQHKKKYNDIIAIDASFLPKATAQQDKAYVSIRTEQQEYDIRRMLSTTHACQHWANFQYKIVPTALGFVPNSLSQFLRHNCFATEAKTLNRLSTIDGQRLKQNWLSYYALALKDASLSKYHLSFALATLAYKKAPEAQISNLFWISVLTSLGVKFPDAPTVVISSSRTADLTKDSYDAEEITKILIRYAEVSHDRHFGSPFTLEMNEDTKHPYSELTAACSKIAKSWAADFWPCREIPDQSEILMEAKVKPNAALEVTRRLESWYAARQLNAFIKNVQLILNTNMALRRSQNIAIKSPACFNPITIQLRPVPYSHADITLASILDPGKLSAEALSKLQAVCTTTGQQRPAIANLLEAKNKYLLDARQIENELLRVTETTVTKILQNTGIFPRLAPVVFMRNLPETRSFLPLALGGLWNRIKQINRHLLSLKTGKTSAHQGETAMFAELSYNPSEHPEWLLLELELDISIRPIQVQVAMQMSQMPNKGNGVMQLNMGEGKTSVIVPMLCALQADGSSLCRVTVLGSIFRTNLGILRFSLGGLLNRRIYTFPCRRDLNIDADCADRIQSAYEECLRLKGVVLTLPEYRLSFRLLAIDRLFKNDVGLGLKLQETEKWLRRFCRDILDESDELLNTKYQLVYTVGKQVNVDGGNLRWNFCQHVLEIIGNLSSELHQEFGDDAIELAKGKAELKEFPVIRFLATKSDTSFHDKFNRLLVERVMSGWSYSPSQMEDIKRFLLEPEVSDEFHMKVVSDLQAYPEQLQKLLILYGYIRKQLLVLAFSNRWRVEYGVDTNGYRTMAVPYRAKDVAAERTEFGHPDLAIILTHLSYYYSGLTMHQFGEALLSLLKAPDAEAVYREWIAKVVPVDDTPLPPLHSLNMENPAQMNRLFSLCKRNTLIINFWLSQNVFPRESKQFPQKLVMTSWDLVYEKNRLPTTGFSGTNDSVVLLPPNIPQQDMPQLTDTNTKMESILLGSIKSLKPLKMGVTCLQILETLREAKLRILIDAGALMLQLDNEQIAKLWLEIDEDIEAVVYFGTKNELLVMTREAGNQTNFGNTPFELSPFEEHLEKCAIFLDDQHTRGTDLKFPIGSTACVTVGGSMKREKLMQACMRMRKLGEGHSVSFYISHEAETKIKQMSSDCHISSENLYSWVKGNTKQLNEDGLVHWAIAGRNYSLRLAAEEIYELVASYANPSDAVILAQSCVDDEAIKLLEIYGHRIAMKPITDLIPLWFESVRRKLVKTWGGKDLPQGVADRLEEIEKIVLERCQLHIPQRWHHATSTLVGEEQEKELEVQEEKEVQEERKVERPAKCQPVASRLHPNLLELLEGQEEFKTMDGIFKLPEIFRFTTFASEVQHEGWGPDVFATEDFVTVVESSSTTSTKTDLYLRPVEYLASYKRDDGVVQLLLLSPFEANHLLPNFREEKYSCALHLFASRRFGDQDLLLNRCQLQLPSAAEFGILSQSCLIAEDTNEMTALLVAAGNLYFSGVKEQEAFARFLCVALKPWSKKYERMFQDGTISPSGFILPDTVKRMSRSRFQSDPSGLVRSILNCRHTVISKVSHVIRLLEDRTYLKMSK